MRVQLRRAYDTEEGAVEVDEACVDGRARGVCSPHEIP